MNDRYEKYMKSLIQKDKYLFVFELLFSIFFCCTIIGIIYVLVEKDWGEIHLLAFLLAITGIIWVFWYKIKKSLNIMKKECPKAFVFPFDFDISCEKVINYLSKNRNLVSQKDFDNMKIMEFFENVNRSSTVITRISIFNASNFDKYNYQKLLKNNHDIFNKIFKQDWIIHRWDKRSWQRYDLIFADNWTSDLDKFINNYANKELGRTETRVFAVFYQNSLFIRPIFGGSNYITEPKVYYYSVKDIINLVINSQKDYKTK